MFHPILQKLQFRPNQNGHKQLSIVGESKRRRFRIIRNLWHHHIKRHYRSNSTRRDYVLLLAQPQPLDLRPLRKSLRFPSYNTRILDHETTTRWSYADLSSFRWLLPFLIFNMKELLQTLVLYACPNQTPTLPTQHLFLPRKAVLG